MSRPIIINVRGTSGSGKSTLARALMARYATRMPFRVQGRKQPIGYLCARRQPSSERSLWTVGHYETACGGGDTITSMDAVYTQVREAAGQGHDVLYEGAIVTTEVERCAALRDLDARLVVIGLTTPIEVCAEGIRARRAARGDERPLDLTNTINRDKTSRRTVAKLRDRGVECYELDRDEALALALDLLNLKGDAT